MKPRLPAPRIDWRSPRLRVTGTPMRVALALGVAATLGLSMALPCAAQDVPDKAFEIFPVHVAPRGAGAPVLPTPGASTNELGEVAFVVRDEGGDALMLRGFYGAVHRVLSAGDPLAGGTVSQIVVMPNSLDEYRRILFHAELDGGHAGLFRAVPEPRLREVLPSWGYRDGSITFMLRGSGLSPETIVHFGELRTPVTAVDATTLTGVIPYSEDLPVGPVQVSVGRRGGVPHVLSEAFEFRDRPTSGCEGFWPDHRPPAVFRPASLPGSPWVYGLAFCLHRGWRRRKSAAPANDPAATRPGGAGSPG